MSDLSTKEKRKLEAFFEMSSGYYLDFSNNTLETFIADRLDLELYSDKYHQGSGSKANRIRAIWDLEPNHLVGKLFRETIENDDDERLINPHMNKRDVELKSHCLLIAQRLESANPFQPQPQQNPSFNTQPAFKPAQSVQTQSGFQQQNPPFNTQPAFKPTQSVQTQSGFQQQNPPFNTQPAFKPGQAQQNIKQQFPPQQPFSNQNSFSQSSKQQVAKNKVFIVHGHDDLAKEQIARFVSQVGLEPIILHEQASSSKTIIEKIEKYAEQVCFAVVLYTPCDQGSKNGDSNQLPRARQNVVFEHGYFIGKLGRENVTAVVKGNVEKPNDISGVVYETFDENGAWKLKLAKEIKNSGCQIDMNNII